jgi:hypothetical protein
VNNSGAVVRSLLPRGSIANCYAFYDGKVEFGICDYEVFVKAHTSSLPVYHFWKCMEYDRHRVYNIVTSDDFKFKDEQMFSVLQDIWHENKSVFTKSALFYFLNAHSDTGLVSSGEISKEFFNPISNLSLKKFKMPNNMHVIYNKDNSIEELISNSGPAEYNYVNAGKFNYGLFQHGKNRGPEETIINHRKLIETFKKTKNKVIISYNYDNRIVKLVRDNRILLVDKYGREITDEKRAVEMVIANF